MADTKDKLPGVTLFLTTSKRYNVAGRKKARAEFECDIDSEVTWDEVEKMLIAGFKIYTDDDFKGELLSVFREEVKQLEGQANVYKYEKERLEVENRRLRDNVEQYQRQLSNLGRQILGKR